MTVTSFRPAMTWPLVPPELAELRRRSKCAGVLARSIPSRCPSRTLGVEGRGPVSIPATVGGLSQAFPCFGRNQATTSLRN
jgi:hypothetical protein